MSIDQLKREVLRLTIDQKINPHSRQWQEIRDQIYQYNEENRQREQLSFETFHTLRKELEDFSVESIAVESDDSSGSESSVNKVSSNQGVKRKKSGRSGHHSTLTASSHNPTSAKSRSSKAKSKPVQRFGGV